MGEGRIRKRGLIAELQWKTFRATKLVRQRLPWPTAPETPLSVFVCGVHCSGTTMTMDILRASYETMVFGDPDTRAFEQQILRPVPIIRNLIDQSRAEVIAFKVLHDAHLVRLFLEQFDPAKVIWVIRTFDGVVNSSLSRWPGWRNKVEEIVSDRRNADWRGFGMTEQTHSTLRAHYHTGLSDGSAQALFWYYRHQLLFDQKLESDWRVTTLFYDEAIASPQDTSRRVAQFLNIASSSRMERVPRRQHTPGVPQDISPAIRRLCDAMQDRLIELHRMKHGLSSQQYR